MKDIRAFKISQVPSLEVQGRVVEVLADIHDKWQFMASAKKRKLSAIDEIKKSILHQAFTGQLTAKSTDQQLEAVA